MNIELDNVYNFDCIQGIKLMQDQGVKADCLLTDIPYGEVNKNNEPNRKSKRLRNLDKGEADICTFDIDKFLETVFPVVNGVFMIFCGIEQVSTIKYFFGSNGCSTRLLIWEKTNPSPMQGKNVYLSGIECCIYAKKKGATFNAFCKNTVFRYPCGKHEMHPTQKPLSLWYELLRDNTNEGQIVLDPCIGSFTTAVACWKMKRHYIGFELNKRYYDLGSRRLQELKRQLSLF